MTSHAVPDAELIERLTSCCREDGTLTLFEGDLINPDGPEAASRLAELQAERTRLREALGDLLLSAQRVANKYGRDPDTDELLDWTEWQNVRDDCRKARAALSASPIAPTGRSPSGSGSRPSGGAAGASPAKPSIPNAVALAYGLLWHMEIDREDENLRLASDARNALLSALSRAEQLQGIDLAKLTDARFTGAA